MLRFHRVIGTAACSIRIMVAAGLPASAQIKIGAIVRPHCHGGFRRISSLFGALTGAATFSLLEGGLSRLAEYRDLILGPALLLVAIYLHGSMEGLPEGRRRG